MNARRFVGITLLLVLWYFLAGLIGERVLNVVPAGLSDEAFFLAHAALPWSLLALEFLTPAHSELGGAVRDLLFLAVAAAGIAVNAWLLYASLRRLLRHRKFRATIAAVGARPRPRS